MILGLSHHHLRPRRKFDPRLSKRAPPAEVPSCSPWMENISSPGGEASLALQESRQTDNPWLGNHPASLQRGTQAEVRRIEERNDFLWRVSTAGYGSVQSAKVRYGSRFHCPKVELSRTAPCSPQSTPPLGFFSWLSTKAAAFLSLSSP